MEQPSEGREVVALPLSESHPTVLSIGPAPAPAPAPSSADTGAAAKPVDSVNNYNNHNNNQNIPPQPIASSDGFANASAAPSHPLPAATQFAPPSSEPKPFQPPALVVPPPPAAAVTAPDISDLHSPLSALSNAVPQFQMPAPPHPGVSPVLRTESPASSDESDDPFTHFGPVRFALSETNSYLQPLLTL